MFRRRIRDNEYEFPSDRPIAVASKELIQLILAPKPEERPALLDVVHHSFFTSGIFPPYIPVSSHDIAPDFRSITRGASEANFRRVRRAALLDEDQITSIAVPYASMDMTFTNDAPTRSVTSAIAQQEKEFQKAVQPGSPLSALLNSARKPLLRSTGPSGSTVTKESPLFRKLQAASTNPSPLRHASGSALPRTVTGHVGASALGHIAEEEDGTDEPGKKRKNRTKELEAQKARIVAQMAPVREEEDRYEAAVASVNERRLPERKEIRKPSVKENHLPSLLAIYFGF